MLINTTASVRFFNPTGELHSFYHVDPLGETLADEDIEPGDSVAVGNLGRVGHDTSPETSEEGTYPFRCRYHSDDFGQGMSGEIVVRAEGAA